MRPLSKSASTLCLLLCLAVLSTFSARAQQKGSVSLWLTTPDRASLLARQSVPLHFTKSAPSSSVIDVNDKQKYQSIDGFGFALTGGSAQLLMRMSAPQRGDLLRELFGTGDEQIGVSYIRISIGSSDMNDHAFTYDDLAPGKTDPDLADFSLGPDSTTVVPVLKEILAINPGIKILGSPWSPPAWMKTNDDLKAGSLKPEYYETYARYFVKYIQAMKAEGITIDAITPQNEPLNPNNTPSMVMEAPAEAQFIEQSLGPAFRHAGIRTKIIVYDHNCDRPDYPLTILADPEARQYVDGSGFHLYEGEITALTKVHNAYPDKNLYFTEQMVVDHPGDPKLHIAESVKNLIIGAPRNWSRNVLLWNLAADPSFGPHTNNGGCPVCEGAITLDGNAVTRNVAYYTVAHASKFVRPGSVRIASSEGPLPNVAFRTPSGDKVLIVANDSDSPQQFQIHFHGKALNTALNAGAVGTYVWK
jgi:glucosylceramidase